MQAGFPDDQSCFTSFALRLASEADCLVGIGCMPEFDNTDGTLLRSQGYSFDEQAVCFGQFVRALRAESSDSSSSLILGVHDWGVAPGLIYTRRVSKNLEGDRALIPSKVVCFDVLPPANLKRPFEGVPIYWGIFVHLVYRTAFATAFALSRVWHFLGVLFLQFALISYLAYLAGV